MYVCVNLYNFFGNVAAAMSLLVAMMSVLRLQQLGHGHGHGHGHGLLFSRAFSWRVPSAILCRPPRRPVSEPGPGWLESQPSATRERRLRTESRRNRNAKRSIENFAESEKSIAASGEYIFCHLN